MTFREDYIKKYRELGSRMFSECYIPNISDFALAFGSKKDEESLNKIKRITDFTENFEDIENSCNRERANYTEEESVKFIKSVISANVTDIVNSGMLYKYAMASTDDMEIILDDCGSFGYEYTLPIDEKFYNFYIRNHYVLELDDYTEDYETFSKLTNGLLIIHVRRFVDCLADSRHRKFCKKCAGLFRRSKETEFIPKYIGQYATLMVTEKATQASLDSMNKGESVSVNVLLNRSITDEVNNYDDVIKIIDRILSEIGTESTVESRFYELILLSRNYDLEFAPLTTSMLRQKDTFGAFIYRPKQQLKNLLSKEKIELTSIKSKIVFDDY